MPGDGDSTDVSINKKRKQDRGAPGHETSSSLVDDMAEPNANKEIVILLSMLPCLLTASETWTDRPSSQINAHSYQLSFMNGQKRGLNRWMTRGNS